MHAHGVDTELWSRCPARARRDWAEREACRAGDAGGRGLRGPPAGREAAAAAASSAERAPDASAKRVIYVSLVYLTLGYAI